MVYRWPIILRRALEDYAKKLEDYEQEEERLRALEEAEQLAEAMELDLTEALAPERAGKGLKGFAVGHPLQRARRRLFVKVLLRRARAYELLKRPEEALEDLMAVGKPGSGARFG